MLGKGVMSWARRCHAVAHGARAPRHGTGAARAWMTIKLSNTGRKTRSLEEQMAKLRQRVWLCARRRQRDSVTIATVWRVALWRASVAGARDLRGGPR